MGPLDTQYLVKHYQDIIDQAQLDGLQWLASRLPINYQE